MLTTAVAFNRLTIAAAAVEAAITANRRRKSLAWARRFNRVLALTTLDDYVAWINRDGETFALMGADHWRARGVTTAPRLGRLLDAEARRSQEKEERYG